MEEEVGGSKESAEDGPGGKAWWCLLGFRQRAEVHPTVALAIARLRSSRGGEGISR